MTRKRRKAQPHEVASWLHDRGMTIGEFLADHYRETGVADEDRPPIHATTGENLPGIRLHGVRISNGHATFGPKGFLPLKSGRVVLRVVPGHCSLSNGDPRAKDFVEWITGDAAGYHFKFWPDGKDNGSHRSYIPARLLLIFEWGHGRHGLWLPLAVR